MSSNVATVYQKVIDDVIEKARDEFLVEDVDLSVLQELQSLWELKLMQTGALGDPRAALPLPAPPVPPPGRSAGGQSVRQAPPPQAASNARSRDASLTASLVQGHDLNVPYTEEGDVPAPPYNIHSVQYGAPPNTGAYMTALQQQQPQQPYQQAQLPYQQQQQAYHHQQQAQQSYMSGGAPYGGGALATGHPAAMQGRGYVSVGKPEPYLPPPRSWAPQAQPHYNLPRGVDLNQALVDDGNVQDGISQSLYPGKRQRLQEEPAHSAIPQLDGAWEETEGVSRGGQQQRQCLGAGAVHSGVQATRTESLQAYAQREWDLMKHQKGLISAPQSGSASAIDFMRPLSHQGSAARCSTSLVARTGTVDIASETASHQFISPRSPISTSFNLSSGVQDARRAASHGSSSPAVGVMFTSGATGPPSGTTVIGVRRRGVPQWDGAEDGDEDDEEEGEEGEGEDANGGEGTGLPGVKDEEGLAEEEDEDYNEAAEDTDANGPNATNADEAAAPTEEEEDAEPPLGADDDDEDDLEDVTASAEGDPKMDNMVMATYDKEVTRSKNKWRCVLKEGIMHLGGRDIVFGKATGEFEF
eukprot:TRINITY_DN2845_c0_g1_i3.p1 TRINITY_DN2845_c0_g1~~TRINITY_DN2845_c0_g1_i3.p1  ORF type:complete len:585 (-),score=160.88 TRINITY_DN2845_c0_g1_i3:885-2639(-)